MPTSLYLAPAGHGKTAHALELVREAARDLKSCPRVCVANRQQLATWQRRLAGEGGSLGVHLLTFDDLYTTCLSAAAEPYTSIGDVAEYRLLRAIVAALPLEYYAPVSVYPGFVQECQRLIGEMKSAQITPQTFLTAVRHMGDAPRLREIGRVYESYQRYLHENKLADSRGLGWLAIDALKRRAPQVARDWPILILDGFASFTQTQLSLLHILQQRVPAITITLTADSAATQPRVSHRHFARTCRLIEEKLAVTAQMLPGASPMSNGAFASLEAGLFDNKPAASAAPPQDAQYDTPPLSLVAVPDHATEVRVALRWLKQRIVEDDVPLYETSLAARDIALYRPFILQTAAEFELPVYFVDGPPLPKNPCVAAIFTLLRLLLPAPGSGVAYKPSLPRRAFIASLRSPYFDWQALASDDDFAAPAGLNADDVELLDTVGRWGRVIAGPDQWWEIMERLAAIEPAQTRSDASGRRQEALPSYLPRGTQALELQEKVRTILKRLAPPLGPAPYSQYVRWLERLLGPDQHEPHEQRSATLNVLSRARQADGNIQKRDVVALRRLKDLMHSLVWVEQVGIQNELIDYTQFFDELSGAAEAATYHPGSRQQHNAILVSDVIQGRGVPCRALAVLGMAEGLFPASLSEGPFLRESDRATLREKFSLPFESAIESHEQEYFYETVTRARQWLLFTRPSQAESGATWQPSPFWNEVQRVAGAATNDNLADHSRRAPVASPAELLQRLAEVGDGDLSAVGGQTAIASRWRQVKEAAAIFTARWSRSPSPFDGLLAGSSREMAERFGPGYGWSPSRLESYLSCPLQFFLASVLRIESRPEPQEGLDARQLGNIYHRLLEETYRRLPLSQRTDVEHLQASLDVVAARILTEAPRREGFRETAWWQETRRAIRKNVELSLTHLAELAGAFAPTHFELFFGGKHALFIERDGERILGRGVIDRIDVDDQGRLRLIDYKTAGPYGYTGAAHRHGRRIQLPLYALAVQEALGLGPVVDGFYWHVQQAEPSSFSLQAADVPASIQIAADYAWQAVDGARSGRFAPQPPDGGCPQYCPGASFCWRYTPQRTY